jgi:AcrR family transcriptional regulator
MPGRSGTAKRPTNRKSKDTGGAQNERRTKILNAAAKVFAEKGFENATVRDIGDECGMVSGGLYYHFPSKDAMLHEILMGTMDRLLEEYSAVRDDEGDAETRLSRLFEVALQFIVDQPSAAHILQNEFERFKHLESFKPIYKRYSEIRKVWREVLEHGVSQGLLRGDVDLDLAYRVLMGAVLSTVHWFEPTGRYSIATIAKTHSAILIGGMAHPGASVERERARAGS